MSEIAKYDNLDDLFQDFDAYLMHYGRSIRDGAPIGSGRYPWGSGEDEGGLRRTIRIGGKEVEVDLHRYIPKDKLQENYPRYLQFVNDVNRMRHEENKTDDQIASIMKLKNATELKRRYSVSNDICRLYNLARYQELKNSSHHYSRREIGEILGGVSEGTLRGWEDQIKADAANKTFGAVEKIRDTLEDRGFVDVGFGVEKRLNVSQDRLKSAIMMLQDEGYKLRKFDVKQSGTGEPMHMYALAKPEITVGYIKDHPLEFGPPAYNNEIHDVYRIEPPVSVDSSRILVKYAEEGGIERDGFVGLRRGVEDISLGMAHYAQVRIAVDGTHYIKGMAAYDDDAFKGVPDKYDIIVYSNKHQGVPLKSDDPDAKQVLKPMKDPSKTPDGNPFGASIKLDKDLILAQRHYVDKDGNTKLSALNIVNEEGAWEKWSRNLPAQFLSKQSNPLIERQLTITAAQKLKEFQEIMALTNPNVKRKLLMDFADDCDSASYHLKAAKVNSSQQVHVIMPFPEIAPDEIFAPNYKTGDKVVCIRYPHAGTFEIAELTVNNNYPSAIKTLGLQAKDAVGISSKPAGILSGADFDGDTVTVILNNDGRIQLYDRNGNPNSPLLKLREFDPKEEYPPIRDENGTIISRRMKTEEFKGKQMGIITNLITDMQVLGCTDEELARAVKHSMVVIDAYKHGLNYTKSYKDNRIAELKRKYQYDPVEDKVGGASTLLSRAKSPTHIDDRKVKWSGVTEDGHPIKRGIDTVTGKKVYEDAGERGWKLVEDPETGEVEWKRVKRHQQVYRMETVSDARELYSDPKNPDVKEVLYAAYANRMKALAGEARKAFLATTPIKASASAREIYKNEVQSLERKLNDALKNKPLERKAQLLASKIKSDIDEDNPGMDEGDKKKKQNQAISYARQRVGSVRKKFSITEDEWKAIQAGAVSSSKLDLILTVADPDQVRSYATPRKTTALSAADIAFAKSLSKKDDISRAEIAAMLHVSVSTLSRALSSKS